MNSCINDFATLKRLFYQMLRIRLVEEKIAEIYPEQEMRCPVHLCTGQEAVPSGVCSALDTHDFVMSTHRSHGHYLAKGGSLKAMIAECYGRATGCSGGRGGSMHLIDLQAGFLGSVSIVAGSIPIAVGAAFGSVMQGHQKVVAVFFGDAATEEGVFYESLNFASLKKLPVLFICENNLYSVYSPLRVRRPPQQNISDLAHCHGLEVIQGEGNDVIDVFDKTRTALEMITHESGPVFLEFSTYRWREHCGPNYDNDIGYRTEEEFMEWKKKCPVETMKEILLNKNIMFAEDFKQMTLEINEEIKAAFLYAKQSPFPDLQTTFNCIYA